ncbi:Alpha/Beta hydrolase protein [Colletotrichum phormii]|uniref:Alpha/Beta hydrolase protein n=1 Tax=Colletotrichum phormii TaxID=359342 RepID=A0AAI9ZM50_9PEZI|nr:Alpha/Beta hydrolase protein [Colletotrichum phormii]KAK1625806.1 Alpha/Beta hydrolase protein [Colletotrichum phormii]
MNPGPYLLPHRWKLCISNCFGVDASSFISRDLTPPANGIAGHEGGADVLLSFLQNKVKPLVARRLYESRGATVGREALYGHSYGGLLSLYALFTRTDMFTCILASSRSVWWNEGYIVTEERRFREKVDCKNSSPSLMLFVANEEQTPTRSRGEGEDEYNRRLRRHRGLHMVDNVISMNSRLERSARLERLSIRVYHGEDHETVVACSLNRGLATFLDDWPLV